MASSRADLSLPLSGPSSRIFSAPRPQLSSTSSHVSSIHAQEWVPPVTLESLDNEGVIQLPPDQAADLLYRLDGDHQDLHDAEEEGEEENGLLGGEGEGVGRDDSAHWNRLRHESRMGRRWWKRPSPYWSVAFTLTDLSRTTVANLSSCLPCFAGSLSSRSDMPSRWALASRQRARSTIRLPGESFFGSRRPHAAKVLTCAPITQSCSLPDDFERRLLASLLRACRSWRP